MTFDPSLYAHALASLAIWAILSQVLAGVSTIGRTPDRAPCGKPVRDYSNPVYRRERAFANAIESSGPFVAATVAAMLVGASPFWVNLLASVFVVARIAMAVVHVRTENQTMRSAFFAIGLFMTAGLALLALIGAFAL
ncbi:MAPEG family protein [Jannaschia sp. M317]|uniref:MAPEG family protein n=1 Tax=Jannaschia sp. M317 TaxID=2867011 RepID=UPI0021A2B91F|nr:MAPEG family protein [Jannaschia sp. M317]UWQ17811.1 MAPEG family protein [Jannaschia sp. M317]